MIYLLTISTQELIILCGTVLGLAGIKAGAKITFRRNAMVIEPKDKSL